MYTYEKCAAVATIQKREQFCAEANDSTSLNECLKLDNYCQSCCTTLFNPYFSQLYYFNCFKDCLTET